MSDKKQYLQTLVRQDKLVLSKFPKVSAQVWDQFHQLQLSQNSSVESIFKDRQSDFEFESINDNVFIIGFCACIKCRSVYKASPAVGTSTIKRHVCSSGK